MENCAKARIDTHLKNIYEQVQDIVAKDTIDFYKNGDCSNGRQNFDFGAEILREEKTMSENSKKTKLENINTKVAPEGEYNNITVSQVKVTAILNNSELEEKDCIKDDVEDDQDDQDNDDDDSYATDDNSSTQQGEQNTDEQINDSVETDESSTDSDYSDISGLSDVSGREWKPINPRPIHWVQRQIHSGANPRELLSQILPTSAQQLAPNLNDMTLWRILASMLSEPPRRRKLSYINTFEDVIDLVQQSQNIIVLTGAGVSVSCGIPDFRSSDGIYSRLAKDYPDLPDPQAMFDINYFSRDPRPFYKFAREIYPGQFKPSPCHRFIKLLEDKQKLLRNYTQNIDTLEQVAGIRNVIECHGSFSTASCTKCKLKCDADTIRPDIFAQRIPVCCHCQPNVQQSVDASEPVSEEELRRLVENGIMKPDIVFFGEGLPDEFHTVMASDKDKCDLLIVIGSSLKVRPVALIPSSIPANVPQILINREQLHHLEFDVELLGDSDVIINQLCHRLGAEWKDICIDNKVLSESKELLPIDEDTSTEGEGETEDDVQQLQDTDTQSTQSCSSADIALRAAGAYSDSGFESSTSSGLILNKPATGKATMATIKHLKMNAVERKKVAINKSAINIPGLLDEPTDAVDFGLTQESTSSIYTESYRHLSIDSSKDSGIQTDSSNSALPPAHNIEALLPPITKFGDSGGTKLTNSNELPHADTNTTITAEKDITFGSVEDKRTVTDTGRNLKRIRQKKRQSAAERLVPGTFYSYDGSASYVFPGAQVSWCTDTDDDTEYESDENDENDENDNDDNDENEENENDGNDFEQDESAEIDGVISSETDIIVSSNTKELCTNLTAPRSTIDEYKLQSTTAVLRVCKTTTRKRSSTDDNSVCDETIAKNSCVMLTQESKILTEPSSSSDTCYPPPIKKKRDSFEDATTDGENSSSSSVSNNSDDNSNNTLIYNNNGNKNSKTSNSDDNVLSSSSNEPTLTKFGVTKPLLHQL